MTPARSRYPSLFLLLALLGGGFGLPLADALIFHGTPGGRAVADRLLSSGERATSHVQVCHLGDATPARSLASPPATPTLPAPITTRVRTVLDQRFVASSELTLPLSRGPPSAA